MVTTGVKCFCKHHVDDHIYDAETNGYFECNLCECEFFETPSFNNDLVSASYI